MVRMGNRGILIMLQLQLFKEPQGTMWQIMQDCVLELTEDLEFRTWGDLSSRAEGYATLPARSDVIPRFTAEFWKF